MNNLMSKDSIRASGGIIRGRNVIWKPWKEKPENQGNYALVHSGRTPMLSKDRLFRKVEIIRLGLKNMKQYRKRFKKSFNQKGEVKCQ